MLITAFIYTLSWVVSEIESVGSVVVTAVEDGFRFIETGYYYMIEAVIGESILNITSRGIVKRKELYISSTTSGEEYPYLDVWKGLEDAKVLGLSKSIGCLNFNSSQINKIIFNSKIRPAVNKIEINSTMASMDLVAYCQSEDIQVISYGPFGFAVPRLFNNKTLPPSFDDPTLVAIANKYDKSTSQVFLSYLIDRDIIPIPKSTNKEHIRSNIDVFNFHLTNIEIYKISEFDLNTAVYLQIGKFFPNEFFIYTFGASLQEIFDADDVL